jgi:hypothetical protein
MVMSAGSRIGRTRTPPGAVPAAGQVASTTAFSSASTASFSQAGIGLRVTPKGSGSVQVTFSGYLTASATTANVGIILQISYGTGTSPAAASAAAGTVVGEPMEFTVGTTLTAAADLHAPIALQSLIQNLNPGVSYWFDIQAKAVTTISITSVNNPVLTVTEQGSGTVLPGPATVGGVPTTQSLTSGSSATYTTPAGAKWLEVFMVGGGGGGGGANTSTTLVAGSAGGTSTFNSINAAGGSGGGVGVAGAGNAGAGGTGGTGTATRRQPGGPGGNPLNFASTSGFGGPGGDTYFGGGGVGTASSTAAGNSAAANTGAGGGGGANSNSPAAAGGGGGGEFVYLLIVSPAATYTYTIGTSGAGGSTTDSGGAGGTGFIFVIEHYT